MKIISKLIVFLFLSLSMQYVMAQPNTGFASAATEFNNYLTAIKTIQANFTQTTYNNNGDVAQVAQGKMALERPGKFRWEVTKPMPQLVVANNTRVWIYDADLEQVTIRNLNIAEGNAPALLLSHDQAISEKDYDISFAKKASEGLRWFVLKPKKQDSMFEIVSMGFDNGQIKQMILKDHLGHTVKVVYNNIKTNMKLSESLFTFKPPANIDVIDETKK